MAYPQPGPFPAYPQYPGQIGMPAKPPMPKTVQNAFYLMLAGAGLQLIAGITTLASRSRIRDQVITHNPSFDTTQVDNTVNAAMVGAGVSVVIGIGLWIWMAFANRAGKNWARITGTVFFGIESLSVLVGLAVSSSSAVGTVKISAVNTVLSVLVWLVGLATVILLWNKQSGPYFKPPQIGGGFGYPYPYAMPGQQPMPPTAPGQPGFPQPPGFSGQPGTQPQPPYGAPAQPQQPEPQQRPDDPWSNPSQ